MKSIFLSTVLAIIIAIEADVRTDDSSGFSSIQSIRRLRPAELTKEKDNETLVEAVNASDISKEETSKASIGNIRKKANESVHEKRNLKNFFSSALEETQVIRNDTDGSNATLAIEDIAIAAAQQDNSSRFLSKPRGRLPRTHVTNEKSQETLVEAAKNAIDLFNKKETNKADTKTTKEVNAFVNGKTNDENIVVSAEVEAIQNAIGGENSIALTSHNHKKSSKSGKKAKISKAVPTCPPRNRRTRQPSPQPVRRISPTSAPTGSSIVVTRRKKRPQEETPTSVPTVDSTLVVARRKKKPQEEPLPRQRRDPPVVPGSPTSVPSYAAVARQRLPGRRPTSSPTTCSNMYASENVVDVCPIWHSKSPIRIISRNTNDIEFTIEQAWKCGSGGNTGGDMVQEVATHFHEDGKETCVNTKNFYCGTNTEIFTSSCVEGIAEIKLWLYDTSLNREDGSDVSEVASPLCSLPSNSLAKQCHFMFEVTCEDICVVSTASPPISFSPSE
eukprot:scaffold131534_cov72-Attheya_sp.AAC.1